MGVLIWLAVMGVLGLALWLELRTLPRATAEEMAANGTAMLGAKRVVVVIAHPDDAEYWISGTLKLLGDAGARVVLVVASDGEKGRNLVNSPDLAATRRAEQAAAGSVMGYDEIVFLGQPDRSAADADVVPKLVEEVFKKEDPDLVITFDGWKPQLPYLHPDHEAMGRLAVRVLNNLDMKPALYLFHTRRPDTLMDISPVAKAKVEAMRKHVSQNGGQAMRRRTTELFRAVRKR